MQERVLNDRDQFPTERVLGAHLGKAGVLWRSLFDALRRDHPDLREQWRYYDDGKSWLLNVSLKAKTVCWVGVGEGTFRLTSYFTDRAAGAIRASKLSAPLKSRFAHPEKPAKLRGITVTFRSKRDIADARTLLDLKVDAIAPAGAVRRSAVHARARA